MKMRFGKYKGRELPELDTEYLAWLAGLAVFTPQLSEKYKADLRIAIAQELENRLAAHVADGHKIPDWWLEDYNLKPPEGTLLN